jgi:hypothetical protein
MHQNAQKASKMHVFLALFGTAANGNQSKTRAVASVEVYNPDSTVIFHDNAPRYVH